MSTDNVIEQLREEIAALRREVADLKADRAVHHYHHQVHGQTLLAPQPQPRPYYPGEPWPAMAGGVIETKAELFYNGGAIATYGPDN